MSDWVYHWRPGASSASPTWLLLHGTGGDEHDLVPLGDTLASSWSILSPRGRVSERGHNRFFRRYAEGVFDLEDVEARTHELAEFVRTQSQERAFPLERVVAMGYSNGANIAATLLFHHPDHLRAAVLIRAMTVLPDPPPNDLTGRAVLLLSGRHDPILPLASAEHLAAQLHERGAVVEHHVFEAGHELTRADVETARAWLERLQP